MNSLLTRGLRNVCLRGGGSCGLTSITVWSCSFLSEAENTVWPADAKGAMSFDDGDRWSGGIPAVRKLDTTARHAAFRALDVPSRNWRNVFPWKDRGNIVESGWA